MAELEAINPFDKPQARREREIFEKLHSDADCFVVENLAEFYGLVAELVVSGRPGICMSRGFTRHRSNLRPVKADFGSGHDNGAGGLSVSYRYTKAGVLLIKLRNSSVEQGELDLDGSGANRRELMRAVDMHQ